MCKLGHQIDTVFKAKGGNHRIKLNNKEVITVTADVYTAWILGNAVPVEYNEYYNAVPVYTFPEWSNDTPIIDYILFTEREDI